MPRLFPRKGFGGWFHDALGVLEYTIGDGGFSIGVEGTGEVGPSLEYSGSGGMDRGGARRPWCMVDFRWMVLSAT